MKERRYSDETYRNHEIRVLAERFDADSSWTIEVHIQAPDGSHVPTIRDADHSYEILEIAFATGSEIGRRVVASQ